MPRNSALIALRAILVKLYPREDDARQLAMTACLDPQYIEFSEKAINNWTNILDYARKNEQVEDIIRAARSQFTGNSELNEARKLWLACGSQSGVQVSFAPSWPSPPIHR